MRILGIDASLTGTGLARPDGSTLTMRTPLKGAVRLQWLRNSIEIHVLSADLVLLEGYAYGKHNKAHQVGEWGGVLRLLLHESGVPWIEVPPSVLKKFATGAGNADKNAMLAAAIRRLGYAGSSGDEADALWLREMGMQRYGGSDVVLPASQLAVLTNVEWPPLAPDHAEH